MSLQKGGGLTLGGVVDAFVVYGNLTLTQAITNDYAVTGTGNVELPPPATPQPATGGAYNGYVRVGNFDVGVFKKMTLSADGFVMDVPGRYKVSPAWGSLHHTANSSVVAFVFGVKSAADGLIRFSQRPTPARLPNVTDPGNVSGGGVVDCAVGDELSLWLASNNTGTVTLENANILVEMLDPTVIPAP